MISQLFVNASILISFLFLGGQVFRKKGIGNKLKLSNKILLGILCGIAGCILMLYRLNALNGIIMDFRVKPLIIAVTFGGFWSALITAIIIGAFRIAYFGLNIGSIIGCILMFIFLFSFYYVSKMKKKFLVRYSLMTFIDFFLGAIVYIIFMGDSIEKFILAIFSIGANVVVSVVVYYLLQYMAYNREIYEKLVIDSKKDFLTGLNNVREFNNLFNKATENALKKNEEMTLLLIDIDNFKDVNDKYGHHAGDEVLKELGKILTNSCRFFDIISRNGGEEFTVILLNCNRNDALEIAEILRQNVEDNLFVVNNNEKIHITISIGVAIFSDNMNSTNELYQKADEALYQAKESGRNKVCSSNG